MATRGELDPACESGSWASHRRISEGDRVEAAAGAYEGTRRCPVRFESQASPSDGEPTCGRSTRPRPVENRPARRTVAGEHPSSPLPPRPARGEDPSAGGQGADMQSERPCACASAAPVQSSTTQRRQAGALGTTMPHSFTGTSCDPAPRSPATAARPAATSTRVSRAAPSTKNAMTERIALRLVPLWAETQAKTAGPRMPA